MSEKGKTKEEGREEGSVKRRGRKKCENTISEDAGVSC